MSEVCTTCGVYLTKPYIKCDECKDAPWPFCLHCFAKGPEFEGHKNNHAYTIMRDNFPLFEKRWMASEELKLLDGISSCGFGNWLSVARAVGTKSKEECERHYLEHYVDNQTFPLPKFPDAPVCCAHVNPTPIPYATSYDPPRPQMFSTMYNEMAGYVPARGDFCSEFDDWAEYDIKDIDFEEKDPVLIGLQNAVLSNYRMRLQERYKRKALVKKYAFISAQKNVDELRRYSMLGKEVIEKLRPMMRLVNPAEFDELMEGIMCEAKIKRRIKLLQECREAGISKLQDIGTYVKLKKTHETSHRAKSVFNEVLIHLHNEESRNSFIRKQALSLRDSSEALNTLSSNRKAAPPLDISGLPGYDTLTMKERDLCANLRLLPSSYLHYKTILVHEYTKLGFLKLANARSAIKIDVNKTRKIFDLLLEEGVIKK